MSVGPSRPCQRCTRRGLEGYKGVPHHIQYSTSETNELSHYFPGLYIHNPNSHIITRHRQEAVVPLKYDRDYGHVQRNGLDEFGCVEVDKLRRAQGNPRQSTPKFTGGDVERLTCKFPDNVPTTTMLFKASTAKPTTLLSLASPFPPVPLGNLKVLLLIPLCKFHTPISSLPSHPTKPKLPQLVTQTLFASPIPIPEAAPDPVRDSRRPSSYFPFRFDETDHVLAIGWAEWTVSRSSHSLDLAVENERDVIGGYLRLEGGRESAVDFLDIEPGKNIFGNPRIPFD